MLSLSELNITGKICVIRQDLNVPMHEGKIANLKRLHAAVPTINTALEQRAGVIILSHLGRPEEGKFDPQYSLAPIAKTLAELLNRPVKFEPQYLDGVVCEPGDVVLCENVRFNRGEKSNDPELAKKYAMLGDVFVMDAFGSAHRKHASTYGAVAAANVACAGPILDSEVAALSKALENPQRPLLAIVGGAKVSTKLGVLKGLMETVDQLILGGGLANTLLAAEGHHVGKSLYEPDLIPEMQALMKAANQQNKKILQPLDVMVATEFSADASATVKTIGDIAPDELILDIGPATIQLYQQTILQAGTLIWNGPVGVFEFPAFAAGTNEVSQAIANAPGFTLAGGGETLAAIDQFIHASDLNYVSTGGGAFLEYLEGRELPSLQILKQRAKETV